jgi:hypothetical protein
MTATLGVHGGWGLPIASLADAGVQIVRFPGLQFGDLGWWSRAAKGAGLARMVVIQDGTPNAVSQCALLYPDAEFVEIGNEPDADGVASTPTGIATLAAGISMAWLRFPNAIIVTGGVLNGRVEFVQELLAALAWRPNATPEGMAALLIGLHLYNWPPGLIEPGDPSMADVVERFAAAFGPRLAVTETGLNGKEQPEFTQKALGYLCRHPAIRLVIHYQAQDYTDPIEGVVPMGLWTEDGHEKLSWAAFTAVADAIESVAFHQVLPLAPQPDTITTTSHTGETVFMKLEEVAAKYGGVYGKTVVLAGTAAKPTARIAWVNGVENGFVLEIAGEAGTKVYAPLA